jgi:hypothetical protein
MKERGGEPQAAAYGKKGKKGKKTHTHSYEGSLIFWGKSLDRPKEIIQALEFFFICGQLEAHLVSPQG